MEGVDVTPIPGPVAPETPAGPQERAGPAEVSSFLIFYFLCIVGRLFRPIRIDTSARAASSGILNIQPEQSSHIGGEG